MINFKPVAIAMLMLLSTLNMAVAHEVPLSYDRINFQVSAQEEVANDTLVAVLYSERSGQKSSRIADEVNRDIQWAVDLARQNDKISVQTLHYRQDPLYNNQSIRGWRIRQSIRLESTEVEPLSTLIGEMQQRLSVASIGYALSPARRDEVERRLIAEALNRFDSRGEQVRLQLGRTGYRIVNMNINSSGQSPVPVRMHAAAMMDESAVSAPTIEPGVQTVSVQVSGTIELDIPQ